MPHTSATWFGWNQQILLLCSRDSRNLSHAQRMQKCHRTNKATNEPPKGGPQTGIGIKICRNECWKMGCVVTENDQRLGFPDPSFLLSHGQMERRESTLYNWAIHNSWRRLCLSTLAPSQESAPPEGTSDRWHSSFGSRSYSSPGEQCPVARWCTWGWGNENRMWFYYDLLEFSNQGITFTNHHKPIWACLPTNLDTSLGCMGMPRPAYQRDI